jgi:hypothetical protein
MKNNTNAAPSPTLHDEIRRVIHAIPPIDKIIAFESGELDESATVDLFQQLIDSGLAWQLQGSYGRAARQLIEAGLCSPAPTQEVQ